VTQEPATEQALRGPAPGQWLLEDERRRRRAYLGTQLVAFIAATSLLFVGEEQDVAVTIVRGAVAAFSAITGILLWSRVVGVRAMERALVAFVLVALAALIVRWRLDPAVNIHTLYWLAPGFVLSVLVCGRRVGLSLNLGLYGLLLAIGVSLSWASEPKPVGPLVNSLGLLAMAIALLHALGGRYEALLAARSSAASHELDANTDPLTGIANRRRLDAELVAAVDRARAIGRPLSVVSFDLDEFKGINDRFGHDAGDAVLIEVVARVRRVTRSRDLLGRWGGEEFLLVLDDCDEATGATIAEACRGAIAGDPVSGVGTITASFGVATLVDGEDCEGLLRRLDRRLYAAKSAGRNRVAAGEAADGGSDVCRGQASA